MWKKLKRDVGEREKMNHTNVFNPFRNVSFWVKKTREKMSDAFPPRFASLFVGEKMISIVGLGGGGAEWILIKIYTPC